MFPEVQENNIRIISNFLKIRGDIRKSRCTTGINNSSGKFATCINKTGGKFAIGTAGVVDTGGKFATGVHDSAGKLQPVANNGENFLLHTP
jgi:hypothetical protein